MDSAKLSAFVDGQWDASILPALDTYIRIPCKSPAFDKSWEEHGHLERAVGLIQEWCKEQPIPGLVTEIVKLPGRTPLLFMEIPATDGSTDDTVLLYGHFRSEERRVGKEW